MKRIKKLTALVSIVTLLVGCLAGIQAYAEEVAQTEQPVITSPGTRLTGTNETQKVITAKWVKQSTDTNGYAIEYSLDKSFTSGTKRVKINKVATTSTNLAKLHASKTHYLRIRTYVIDEGITHYSAWSAARATDGFVTVSNLMRGVKVRTGRIYKSPSTKSRTVITLSFSTKVNIKKVKGRWYYVSYTKNKKNYAGYMHSSQVVMYNKNKKHIALTFDDGPKAGTTNIVLRALEKHKCRATFFVVGRNITSKTKKLVKKEYDLGCEIGNHTYTHAKLTRVGARGTKSQLARTDKVVKKIIGSKTTVCRAPYGSINKSILRAMGKPHIYWSVDTLDWKHRSKSNLISTVKKKKRDGAIILMHDIHSSTVKAIDAICRDLKKSGYEAVTVTELAAINGRPLKNGANYRNLYR